MAECRVFSVPLMVTCLMTYGLASRQAFAVEPPAAPTFARVRVVADAGDNAKSASRNEAEKRSGESATSKSPKKAVQRAKASSGDRTAAKATADTLPGADAKTERSVLQLVRTHLPEIDRMLSRLRESNRADYQRAIRDLAKSVRKLELAKKRDEALFEIEVQILKARSNVNLLTAKLKLRDSDSDRHSLRKAGERLLQAEAARDQYDVRVLEERLANTKRQIDALKKRIADKKSHSDSVLEKNYVAYLRRAGLRPEVTKQKKSSKPGEKK